MHDRAPLRELLSRSRPRDATEASHRERMLALLGAPPDPFSRTNYAPGHFTASAFIVSPERDALLLVLHAKLGRWLQPGGHVEPDDAGVVEAARRELREEVSVEAPHLLLPGIFDLDVHTIPARGDAPRHEHFDVRFAFRADRREVLAGSDARAARWVGLREITSLDTDESVLRAVRKLRDGICP